METIMNGSESMRKQISGLLIILLVLLSGIAFGEFLMIYPDNTALKGEEITFDSDSVRVTVPGSWIKDSFYAKPFPSAFKWIKKEAVNLDEALEKRVGQTINWMYEDGTVKSYQLLCSSPILLSSDAGIFEPKNGQPVFKDLDIGKKTQYLQLSFSNPVQKTTYSYLFNNLGYSVVYNLKLQQIQGRAAIDGLLMINNQTQSTVKTNNLYIFSGEINTSEPQQNYKVARSMDFMAEQSSSQPPLDFEEYKIYPIPGHFEFSPDYLHYERFTTSALDYQKIFTYNGYYGNSRSEFQALDQTIKIDKLPIELPAGKVRMIKAENGKDLFLGEDLISNKSAGQQLEINYGKAYDIQGKVEQIQSNRTGDTYIQAYRFTAKNFSESEKDIQLNFTIPRDAEVTVDRVDYGRPVSTLMTIPLQIHAKNETEVTFEIRYNR